MEQQLNGLQRKALVVGVLGLAFCGVGAYLHPEQFFKSYLLGYMFWIGLALGSLALLALHHLVGGGWGFSIQRLLESSTRTLPLLAILFIPFVFGMRELYSWARPEVVAADKLLQHKSLYLNVPFFWIRAAGYFGVWLVLAFFLNRWSGELDKSGEIKLCHRMRTLSGPTILLYVLTLTFASIDWVMSLDAHWFSTIFGFMFVVGQAVLTMAFVIVVLGRLAPHKPLSDLVETKHFHDLGNLLMAFIMLWAYISFSQFLIIWSGNLPEEIPWYLDRMHGGWQWIALLIVLFHFAVPFILLLSRRNKRRLEILSKVALALIFMRMVDLFWIVVPNFHPDGIRVHWLDAAALVGIGGLWLALFVRQLKSRPLLPLQDPRLQEVFQHE
ncbi:MAG: hypothetical protein D6743_07220 [Calditrichaeota bacterium]|nr:MAG: hypothetical protein D6743_07220 [Calditrichota bacterium]